MCFSTFFKLIVGIITLFALFYPIIYVFLCYKQYSNAMCRVMTSILAIIMAASLYGESLYSTYLNDFEYFLDAKTMSISDNFLNIDNGGDAPRIVVDTLTHDADATFKFSVRLANLHNDEGKAYKYYDSIARKFKKESSTELGVVWNYTDSLNYNAIIMRCSNSNLHDLLDKRSMKAGIVRCSGGKVSTLCNLDLDKNVNLHDGLNLVRIVYDGELTTVCIGDKKLNVVAELTDVGYVRGSHFGIYVGKGAHAAVERIVVHTTHNVANDLATSWTAESIEEHFATSTDANEGYWSYLDRNLDDSHLRLGGRYKVALIKTNDGYDIIYIDGAKVCGSDWRCGMKKGSLKRTRFADSYDLVWYDAEKRVFNVDVYASIDDSCILTLHFPIRKSQLRFYKNAGH